MENYPSFIPKFCYHCGHETPEDGEICENCGHELAISPIKFNDLEMKYCYACGSQAQEGSVECKSCGSKLKLPKLEMHTLQAKILRQAGQLMESITDLKKALSFAENHTEKFYICQSIASSYGEYWKPIFEKIESDSDADEIPKEVSESEEFREYVNYAKQALDALKDCPADVQKKAEDDPRSGVAGFRMLVSEYVSMSDPNTKVAIALLKEVEKKVDKTLGGQIALPYGPDAAEYSPSAFCEEMVNQCNIAEKKAPNSKEVSIKSNILKAQLYGNWYEPFGQRRTHNKAVECYEKALALGGDEAFIRYRMALLYRVHAGKDKAIENFQRVVQLVGTDSELGIECAKEIEIEKAQKGGCFIATAVYDSPAAPEVELLRQFRDEVLLKFIGGKFFVAIYYHVSPPIARLISQSQRLKIIVRSYLLKPIIKFISNRRSG